MLANGITFFLSEMIALKTLLDFILRTLIASPVCPSSNANPWVVTLSLELPIVIITVSFFSTSYVNSKCREFQYRASGKVFCNFSPRTSSMLLNEPRALFFKILEISI